MRVQWKDWEGWSYYSFSSKTLAVLLRKKVIQE